MMLSVRLITVLKSVKCVRDCLLCAVLFYRVQYLRVCASMYSTFIALLSFFWGCVSRERCKEEALFQRTYQSQI